MTSAPGESFTRLVERLSAASVRRRWEAYRDVDWDDPALHVDGEDPRWRLPQWDPLGASEWYRDQPEQARSQIGLLRVVALLQVGIEFESLLQQGLLEFASTLPNRDPVFRYVYHEITEEAQHSMMFRELVNRSGVDVSGRSEWIRTLFASILRDATGGWSSFFLAALTAEEVFDQLQRRFLATEPLHPLFHRLCRIHVAEEARHLSFARALLREAVPFHDDREHKLVRFRTPFVVDRMARHILCPQALVDSLATDWHLPPDVEVSVLEGAVAAGLRRSSAAGVVRLCEELDLVDPRLASRWSNLEVSTLEMSTLEAIGVTE